MGVRLLMRRRNETAGAIKAPRRGPGTINIWQDDETRCYRVVGTFEGGSEAYAASMRGAIRLALSMSRWWHKHQSRYLRRLATMDPGDRQPLGWTRPRRCR